MADYEVNASDLMLMIGKLFIEKEMAEKQVVELTQRYDQLLMTTNGNVNDAEKANLTNEIHTAESHNTPE